MIIPISSTVFTINDYRIDVQILKLHYERRQWVSANHSPYQRIREIEILANEMYETKEITEQTSKRLVYCLAAINNWGITLPDEVFYGYGYAKVFDLNTERYVYQLNSALDIEKFLGYQMVAFP